jgi:hypothetical protein
LGIATSYIVSRRPLRTQKTNLAENCALRGYCGVSDEEELEALTLPKPPAESDVTGLIKLSLLMTLKYSALSIQSNLIENFLERQNAVSEPRPSRDARDEKSRTALESDSSGRHRADVGVTLDHWLEKKPCEI